MASCADLLKNILNPVDKKNVVILDYGMGNLFSLKNACKLVGLNAQVTSDNKKIEHADALILPGVGAFNEAMSQMKKQDSLVSVKEFANSGRPLLGICLGMQLLTSESEEVCKTKGLNLIDGSVRRFKPAKIRNGSVIKIPQMGWNKIFDPKKADKFNEKTILENINSGTYMYFAHSYFVDVQDENQLSITEYAGEEYGSSIFKHNIYGVQFHPEKSAKNGLQLINNFKNMIYE